MKRAAGIVTDRGGRTVRWSGDDAAVVRARPLAVTSIDTVVDGVHFSLATHSAGGVTAKDVKLASTIQSFAPVA